MMIRSRFALASSLLVSALAGCSSNSSSGTTQQQREMQTCITVCNKLNTCYPGQTDQTDCTTSCTSSVADGSAPAACNADQFSTAANQCAQQSCSTFALCLEEAGQASGCLTDGGTISIQGTGSSSASSQTGSSTGTRPDASGGSTTGDAGASCATCDKAAQCCQALATFSGSSADAGNCAGLSAANCQASSDPSQYAAGCQQEIAGGQLLNLPACM